MEGSYAPEEELHTSEHSTETLPICPSSLVVLWPAEQWCWEAPLLQPSYVSDTSCLHWHLFSALKIPFYMFQEPSSHPLSRWQTSVEGNRVLKSLFLDCFSAACWNLEAGWVLHRQGSVALQKPFNPSPQFFSMPSLSSNKFVLNLLTASAFQWHALYNLFPTKLQKANKRAKERGLNATTARASVFTMYKTEAVLRSRCRRKR